MLHHDFSHEQRAMSNALRRAIVAASLLVTHCPLLTVSAHAAATDIYISQVGGGNGSSCASAQSVSFFNSSSNWGTGAGQIGPGSKVHLCGTINESAGSTGLTFQGSGTSGNPITLLFEPNAILQAPYWSGGGSNLGGAIIMNGVSWVTVDGGTNGIVRATLNGTPGGACPSGSCSNPAHDGNGVMFQNCTNCTLQNLEVGPIYLRTSLSDTNSASTVGCRAVSKEGQCNNCTIQNNNLHDASSLIEYDLASGNADTNLVVRNNNMHDTSAGIDIAQGNGQSGTLSSFVFSGNSVHDFASWNDPATGGACSGYCFHHDGVHIYTYTSPLSNITIYNNQWYGNLGNGTAWVYYEQYAGGTGAMNVFNNLFDFYATAVNGAGGARAIEIEGNAIATKVYNNTIWGLNNANTIASGLYSNGVPSGSMDVRNTIVGGYLEQLAEGGALNAASTGNVWDCTNGAAITSGGASCGTPPNLDANFKIQNTASSAYHTGANLTGNPSSLINTDMAGAPRPSSGAWDAGAYQFASGSAPTCLNACDVNCDNADNVADVQAEINMALGKATCTNSSGTCNVTSVQKVINAALGGACVAP